MSQEAQKNKFTVKLDGEVVACLERGDVVLLGSGEWKRIEDLAPGDTIKMFTKPLTGKVCVRSARRRKFKTAAI